jgi:predicted RNA polymerase sigma factor
VTGTQTDSFIEHLLRDLTPQVLGAVVRKFRDFANAEDAVQEALLAASAQWPREGLPDNPRAWLTQVAFRRMTDHIRRESSRRRYETPSRRCVLGLKNARQLIRLSRRTTRSYSSLCVVIQR